MLILHKKTKIIFMVINFQLLSLLSCFIFYTEKWIFWRIHWNHLTEFIDEVRNKSKVILNQFQSLNQKIFIGFKLACPRLILVKFIPFTWSTLNWWNLKIEQYNLIWSCDIVWIDQILLLKCWINLKQYVLHI